MIKIRSLRWGDYPELSGQSPKYHPKCPHRREGEGELIHTEEKAM